MKTNRTKIEAALLVVVIFLSIFLFRCTKEGDISVDRKVMLNFPAATTLERYMYIDKTDTIYNTSNNVAGKRLGGYLKKYKFNGVYFYSASSIVGSSSNYNSFSTFLKSLSDSGIIYRAYVGGSSSTFLSTGNVTKYNNSPYATDPNKKINRANLELEWWNGASTWNVWNTNNQQVANGVITDNDFYMGWFLNLGSTPDTIVARDMIKYSDRILLHAYQNGVPKYSYLNSRLTVLAKGARQNNKKANVYIILSAENTTWGAANTFTGPALAAASNQVNPFKYIEDQLYNDIKVNMTQLQKDWININGFVWFTKRYCYYAVKPQ